MTLLELLRQELPKRGGWPEGVNFIAQENGGSMWGFVNEPEKDEDDEWMEILRTGTHKLLGHLPEASDRATAIVTREQYEATDWDGTGLPPVGCDVEYNCYPDGWVIINIVARIKGATFIEWKSGTHKGGDIIRGDFPFERVRPLRTEAERTIDEMVRLSGVSTGAAKILYDAGYRK
jgi:hypothetical protein